MMSPSPKYAALIATLKGSQVDAAMSCFSMLASSVLFVVGVLLMTDDNVDRVFCIQPIVFLVAQSFTVTTVWRDRSMRQNYMVLIDKPTLFYTGQSIAFFVLAVACTVFNFATIAEWKGFYLTSAVWVAISTLSLSKVCRDWNYSSIFAGLPPEDHAECFSKVSQLCKGSIEFRVFVWFSAVLSGFLLCGIVWTWDDDSVEPSAKGFITICALWAEGSTFHFCKIVREYRDVQKRKDLQDNMPFQFLVVLSCVVAHIAIFLALATHKLEDWQRTHLIAAWGFALTTVFVVARHVKDRLDIFKLMESSEMDMMPQGAYGNQSSNQFPMNQTGSYQMSPAGSMQYTGGPSQQYVQHYPVDGTMQYNQQIQMHNGSPPPQYQQQYQQYEHERQAYALQDRHQQQYDGQQMANHDRGQQMAARNPARTEQGGYYNNNAMS